MIYSVKNSRRALAGRRRWWVLLLLPLVPFVLLVALQRSLIYHPRREPVDRSRAEATLGADISEVEVPTDDGLTLGGWLVPVASGEGTPARLALDGSPLCIWLCGNAGHRGNRLGPVSLLHRLGAHVLIVDYRGYGGNAGSPSEEGLARDARAIWTFARTALNVPARRIVICGESLGGGVATRLAADLCDDGEPPAGLFLQATFSSLVDAGKHHYPLLPVNWILRDRFESIRRIGRVTCPLAMVHGQRDRIVPFEQGRRLFEAAPQGSSSGVPKQFFALPEAGHNDILSPEAGAVEDWVRAVQGLLQNVNGGPSGD
jgi:uncharacterized protein